MKTHFFISLLLISLFSPVFAEQETTLTQFLTKVKTLDIAFEQRVSQGGVVHSSAQGKLYLSRPNKLRWEYHRPQKQTIIADGLYIWIYDEDLSQASSSFQRLAVRGTPAEILLNPKGLTKKYQIQQIGETKVILVPKSKKGQYRWISINFTKKGALTSLEMEDKLDQRIQFTFYNEKRNTPLDKALFIFTPPEGTDILDM